MFQKALFFFLCPVLFLLADVSLSSKIPLRLWQTYKTVDLPAFANEARESWMRLNPQFSCLLYDDAAIGSYIQERWSSEFLDFFHSLPIGAMKADLWRYLILASEGGVYSDIDSVCLMPIEKWLLKEPLLSPHILLLDLDLDQSHFCQWTFAATPKHPAMYYVCYYIFNEWRNRKGLLLSSDGKIDVLATTGPIIFSHAIKAYLGESLDTAACTMLKKYNSDKGYREHLNRLGVFFTPKGFFHGKATKNLFWGSWAHRSYDP